MFDFGQCNSMVGRAGLAALTMKVQYLKRIPVVNEALCTGCDLCVRACSQETLELRHRIAVLPWPDRCCSEGECVAACNDGAMRMAWVALDGDRNHGRWISSGRVWRGRVRGGRDQAWG
jgi:uncharacterized Fe-S center protein